MTHPMLPEPYVVARRRRESTDTFTLEVAPADGKPALHFAPGQFNMLHVHGVGEVPISISGAVPARGALRHTIRDVGTVTAALARLRRGDALGVRGPYGTAWPLAPSHGMDVVIVAGGIGIAPLRPAIEHVAEQRARFGRVALLYGARTPADLLFRADLDRWSMRHGITTSVTVDRADAPWHGRVGVVPDLIRQVELDATQAVAWLCGPEIMMRYAALALLDRGLPATRVHLSLERNMRCAVGWCGHCQLGGDLLCRDGPVRSWESVRRRIAVAEL